MLQWTQGCLCSFKVVFCVPLDIFPEVGSLGQKAGPFLVSRGNSILFSTVAAPVCIPTNSALGFPFCTSSPALICWCIDDGRSDPCVIPQCGFFSLLVHSLSSAQRTSQLQLSISYFHTWWDSRTWRVAERGGTHPTTPVTNPGPER